MNIPELAFQHHRVALGKRWLRWSWLLMGVGLLSLVWLWITEPQRFWQIYLVNTLFWLGIAHAGVIFSAIIRGVYGTWGRAILRLAETTAAFVPIGLLLFIGIFFGKMHLFYWSYDPNHAHPKVWMQFNFFVIRQLIPVLVLSAIVWYYFYLSVREDYGILKEHGIPEYSLWGIRWTRNWKGPQEIPEIQKRLVNFGITAIILFALTWSFIAFDMVMAMDRVWYSTMFGGYFFWGALLEALAFTILMTIYVRKRLSWDQILHERVLHDLGILLFAFATFWANLLWAQWLTIWYGNIPEETEFLYTRIVGMWKPLGWATFILIFVIPFVVLIRKKPKVTPWILGSMALTVLVGLWLARFMEIVPTLWHKPYIPLGLGEIGATLGFLGLFMFVYLNALHRVPLVPVGDPKLEEALVPTHHH